MIVCLCRGVSEKVVRLTVAQGARTLDSVSAMCGAGSRCGTCRPMVQGILDEHGNTSRACDRNTCDLSLEEAPADGAALAAALVARTP